MKGPDLNDVHREQGPAAVRERIDKAKRYPNGPDDDVAGQTGTRPNGAAGEPPRPTIRLEAGAFVLVAETAESALLACDAAIFRRGDRLVTPDERDAEDARGEPTKAVQLSEIGLSYLRELMDRAAAFEGWNVRAKDFRPVKPPTDIAQLILERCARWRFPEPAGIISAPTLGPRGEIIARPGLDPASRLLLVNPPPMPPIPDRPTREDAERALVELAGLVTEFAFVDEASRSVALAAMLTVIGRGAFSLAPLFACSAPTPGSGKSFLWDVVSAIATGRTCPVITPGSKGEEMEKRIGGVLFAALPLVSLDNIDPRAPLASSLLCQALERPRPMMRILGTSTVAEVASRTIWFATGNNLQIVDDLTRRCLVAHLDSGLEEPERKQFNSNPLIAIMRDRGRYVAAALTVLRAYLAAGSPARVPRLASFERWSDLVPSALTWCGHADPLETMRTARADDPSFQHRQAVFAAWPAMSDNDATAVTTAEIVERTEHDAALRDAVLAVALGGSGKPDSHRLGKWLDANKSRLANGFQLVKATPRAGRARWFVRRPGIG